MSQKYAFQAKTPAHFGSEKPSALGRKNSVGYIIEFVNNALHRRERHVTFELMAMPCISHFDNCQLTNAAAVNLMQSIVVSHKCR